MTRPLYLISLVEIFRFEQKILLGFIVINDFLKCTFHECVVPVEKLLLKFFKLSLFFTCFLPLIEFFTTSL